MSVFSAIGMRLCYNSDMMKKQLTLGHVHKTYVIYDEDGHPSYILQRINTVAFKDPAALMDNTLKVTSYLKSKGIAAPEFLPFENGEYLMENEEGFWRKTKYIDSLSVHYTDDLRLVSGCAKAFGSFTKWMDGFPGTLTETIPDFHNTKKRLDDCLLAIDQDPYDRRKDAEDLVLLLEKNYKKVCSDYAALLSLAPLRITHGDTKISNVLFDKETLEPKLVIDLDNVMPGMTLYDFADGARALALNAPDRTCVFEKKKYDCFEHSFVSACDVLSKDEKANLMRATKTISAELGARFLEDYLKNDIYFNIEYKDHNLVRAGHLLRWSLAE